LFWMKLNLWNAFLSLWEPQIPNLKNAIIGTCSHQISRCLIPSEHIHITIMSLNCDLRLWFVSNSHVSYSKSPVCWARSKSEGFYRRELNVFNWCTMESVGSSISNNISNTPFFWLVNVNLFVIWSSCELS
jgi:hypothetical protein